MVFFADAGAFQRCCICSAVERVAHSDLSPLLFGAGLAIVFYFMVGIFRHYVTGKDDA